MRRNSFIWRAGLVALCAWPLLACGRGAQPSVPASSTPSSPSTAGQSGVTENAITMNALLANALSVNPRAIRLVVRSPLRLETYNNPSSYLNHQLMDEYAQQFMQYLVSCALPPSQTVSWTPPTDPAATPVEWQGQLGLCPQWHDEGVEDDPACQELVSACLLARNNAFGKAVQISLRGFDTAGQYFGNQSPVPGLGKPEYEAFSEREGAFYGNIFNADYLDPSVWVSVRGERPGEFMLVYEYDTATGRNEWVARQWRGGYSQIPRVAALQQRARAHEDFMRKADIEGGVVYRDMYACWSPEWSQGDAYLHARICAGPTNDARCAARAIGSCADNPAPGARSAPEHLCGREHQPDTGFWDFDDCSGAAAASKPSWQFPITVFLREGCAIVEMQERCARQQYGQYGKLRDQAARGPRRGTKGTTAE